MLFRHALIIAGVDAPAGKRDVMARAREQFSFDGLPFEKLLDLREGLLKPRDVDPTTLLGPYLKGISAVIDAVDRIGK